MQFGDAQLLFLNELIDLVSFMNCEIMLISMTFIMSLDETNETQSFNILSCFSNIH